MNEDIINDVNLVIQKVYSETGETEDTAPEEEEAVIHVHHYPDADVIKLPDGTVIFREKKDTTTNIPIVESKPEDSQAKQPSMVPAYFMVSMFLLFALSSILFQFSVLFNPLTTAITLVAKSQQVSLSGTLQQGRVLNPITVSQSATVNTTGHAHQDAKSATGTVTVYNGSNVAQTINAGTILTGQDGIQVAIDQAATIPAASPPQFGEASVSAHAINAGSAGNIQAFDITIALSNDLTVKNLTSFTGGQNSRDYRTVTKSDISNASAPLKATVMQGSTAALQGQLKPNEALATPSCTTTTASDHNPGNEATQVKIVVSETCSAVAYNQDMLQANVTQLLTTQAIKKLGSGYSMLNNPQITITSATTAKPVMLSFRSVSTWIYALSTQEQKHIKKSIAGKYTQTAYQLLSSLPGIENVSMQTSGFGDDTRIPKDISHIHMLVIYTAA